MEERYSLVTFSDSLKYYNKLNTDEDKEFDVKRFMQLLRNGSLHTVLRVGLIELRRKILNSSRAIASLCDLELFITEYCFTNDGSNEDNTRRLNILRDTSPEVYSMIRNPDFQFTVFLMYVYFTCTCSNIHTSLFKQQILDTMLTYSIDKNCNYMLQFIFCAIVSEQQIKRGVQVLTCSQYKELDEIITAFNRPAVIENFHKSTIDKEYLSTYLDYFSDAREFRAIFDSYQTK